VVIKTTYSSLELLVSINVLLLQWDLSPDPYIFLFVFFANLLFQETNAVKDANDFVFVSNFRCTFDCDVFDIDHKHCFVVVPTSASAFAFPSCGIVKHVKLAS